MDYHISHVLYLDLAQQNFAVSFGLWSTKLPLSDLWWGFLIHKSELIITVLSTGHLDYSSEGNVE